MLVKNFLNTLLTKECFRGDQQFKLLIKCSLYDDYENWSSEEAILTFGERKIKEWRYEIIEGVTMLTLNLEAI